MKKARLKATRPMPDVICVLVESGHSTSATEIGALTPIRRTRTRGRREQPRSVIGAAGAEAHDAVELQLHVARDSLRDERGGLADRAAVRADLRPVVVGDAGARVSGKTPGAADGAVEDVLQVDAGRIAVPAVAERAEGSELAERLVGVGLERIVVLPGAEPLVLVRSAELHFGADVQADRRVASVGEQAGIAEQRVEAAHHDVA